MKNLFIILLSFALALSLAACSSDETDASISLAESELPAQIDPDIQDTPNETDITEVKRYLKDNYEKMWIDGSTSMIPLHQSLNNLFGSGDEVFHSKTVGAFESFIRGSTDILLGVDYSDELLKAAEIGGIELVKKEITREAFVFLINKNNPVQSLTTNQIKDIYSGKITNWSEVGGEDAAINAFQRNADSGSQIRMNKFMGDVELVERHVKYYQGMGDIVEAIADYDAGKYSIAYNMYTFTEKQYENKDVTLLDINGVHPTDETIFNETYPIIIYNYIYYDNNNTLASEFANNLYIYLMSDEGQRLISEAGYVNLNTTYDRNKSVEIPYGYEDGSEIRFEFRDINKGEYYDADENGNLLVFKSYADYVLRDSKYRDKASAREFLERIADSNIPMLMKTAILDAESGRIILNPWWDASMDPEDFFNYKYHDKYYSDLIYFIDADKYVLMAYGKETFDSYMEQDWTKGFYEYTRSYEPGATVEFTKEGLNDLFFRKNQYTVTVNGVEVNEYNFEQDGLKIELAYYQPFK